MSFQDAIKSGSVLSRRFSKLARNSSDGSAVLDAGWGAMQAAAPKLAKAVMQMPPQVAQGVILQYTNAIRLGKDAEASTLASQFARDSLNAYSQQPRKEPRGFGNQAILSKFARRLSNGGNAQPAPKMDAAWFDSFMSAEEAPTPQPQNPAGQGMRTPRGLARLVSKLRDSGNLIPATPAATPAAPDPNAAFQNVKNAYNSYNQAGMGEYEKNLLWSQPQRDIKVADNWWEQKNAPQETPTGGF
jgi:hypothetical protein